MMKKDDAVLASFLTAIFVVIFFLLYLVNSKLEKLISFESDVEEIHESLMKNIQNQIERRMKVPYYRYGNDLLSFEGRYFCQNDGLERTIAYFESPTKAKIWSLDQDENLNKLKPQIMNIELVYDKNSVFAYAYQAVKSKNLKLIDRVRLRHIGINQNNEVLSFFAADDFYESCHP